MDEKAVQKIGIWAVARESFSVSATSFLPAASMGGVPLVAALGLLAVSSYAGNHAFSVLAFAAYSLTVVGVFCAVTLVAQTKALGLDLPRSLPDLLAMPQFWKYLLATGLCLMAPGVVVAATVLAVFVALGAGAPDSAVASLMLAGIGGAFYVAMRLFLVTPAVAAGNAISFSESWKRTEGNALRIGALMFICMFPISLVQSALEGLAKSSEGSALKIAAALAILLTAFVQCLVGGAAGGLAYRRLVSA